MVVIDTVGDTALLHFLPAAAADFHGCNFLPRIPKPFVRYSDQKLLSVLLSSKALVLQTQSICHLHEPGSVFRWHAKFVILEAALAS